MAVAVAVAWLCPWLSSSPHERCWCRSEDPVNAVGPVGRVAASVARLAGLHSPTGPPAQPNSADLVEHSGECQAQLADPGLIAPLGVAPFFHEAVGDVAELHVGM